MATVYRATISSGGLADEAPQAGAGHRRDDRALRARGADGFQPRANTVEIFDFGRTRDGLFYYAMEYLDGLTLGNVEADPIPVARTIHILRQVCAASPGAPKGVVRRDIKPENLMVCRYGGVYDTSRSSTSGW